MLDRPGTQPSPYLARFRRGLRPQLVIDGQRTDTSRPRRCPTSCKQRQCHTVGPARHGDGNMRLGLERAGLRHQGRKLRVAEGRMADRRTVEGRLRNSWLLPGHGPLPGGR